jgi:hypothetical protein
VWNGSDLGLSRGEAIKKFTSAIETYPKDARFFYMRTMARQQLKAEDDAIADAKRGAMLIRRDRGC